MLAYICAKYSGDIERNILLATIYAERVYNLGYIPVTPHLLFPFIKHETKQTREWALKADLEILKKCDRMFVFGEMSKGMRKEIDFAKENNIKLCYMKGNKCLKK